MRGNSVSILGNVTRDCEVRTTKSGRTVASWGVAWNSSRKSEQGGYDDVPHYFDVKCWMSDAQARVVVPQIVKGAKCAVVDGHLEYEKWQDREGRDRTSVRIAVDDPIQGLSFAPPRQRQEAPQQPRQALRYPAYGEPYAAPAPQPAPAYAQQPAPTYAAQQQGQAQPAQGYVQTVYDDDIPF